MNTKMIILAAAGAIFGFAATWWIAAPITLVGEDLAFTRFLSLAAAVTVGAFASMLGGDL